MIDAGIQYVLFIQAKPVVVTDREVFVRTNIEKVTPKEMIHLKNSIEKLPILKNTINSSNANILKDYISNMDDLNDIYSLYLYNIFIIN